MLASSARADNRVVMGLHRSTLLIATVLSAASVAQQIQIRPKLLAGDEFQLEVSRTREDSRRPQTNHVARTLVDVRVASAGATGYVLGWKPGEATFEPQIGDPMLGAVNKIIGGVEFRIVLNADGGFERIANQAEVLPKLQAAVDLVIRQLQQGMPAGDARRFEGLVRQTLSPPNLIVLATNDAQTYVAMYGAELAVGEAVDVSLDQPNPFGGGPLSATLRVRMLSASAESATLTSSTVYSRETLEKMVATLAGQANVKVPTEELTKFKLDMSDEARYVFDRGTGLFSEVTNERRVSSGEMRRLDKCTIRLVKRPRR
jgi:hypothetical protein